ncbi:MAG: HEAT repeat domain-containing protein [Bacteroidetes bacterium]|nr:HEAT repeat domain-containing protein [Bacteroidota bacterium]
MEMDKAKIDELVAKYNEGLCDPEELGQVERLVEEGKIQLTDLKELTKLEEHLHRLIEPTPSKQLDSRFYEMLAGQTQRVAPEQFMWSWFSSKAWFPKFSIGVSLLVAGFAGGMLIQKNAGGHEVVKLSGEVAELKEVVMLSMLEKESATDRLKAVSLSSEIEGKSNRVTEALIKTLNSDPSVNVRLAALDALQPYAKASSVREALVRSISQQDSPLVQVALADLMATLQEKSSVTELKKLLKQRSTPKEVKKRIEENIKVLI